MGKLLILVDAMGGDNAPHSNVLGSINALKRSEGFDIGLIGDSEIIKRIIEDNKFTSSRLKIYHASEVIVGEDEPIKAIRSKKNSSIVIGMRMLKEKSGDVFISSGDTGALLVGGKLIIKSIDGVDRPALPAMLPTKKGHVLLLDAGSNTECDPQNLYQFAQMGSVYMKEVMNIKNPTIGLINVGTEDRKGPTKLKQTFKILSESELNFVGNIEGRDILEGAVDVVICDGFVGNVILKLLEGAASFLFGNIKSILEKNVLSKICALFIKKDLKAFAKKFDYEEEGGTLLFGINGYIIKCHGSSTAKAIANSIIKATEIVKSDLLEKLNDTFKNNETSKGY